MSTYTAMHDYIPEEDEPSRIPMWQNVLLGLCTASSIGAYLFITLASR